MLNFDFEKPHMYEVIDRILIERKENLDNAIFGVIKEIIDGNECLTTVELNETAIVNALKKQIPKKCVDGRYPWAICPTCGGSVNTEIVQEHIQNCETSYCEHCGQAIDWNEPLTHNSKRNNDFKE